MRCEHLAARKSENTEAVIRSAADASGIENEQRTVGLADIVEISALGDVLVEWNMRVSEKDDIRALLVACSNEARKTVFDVVAMPVRHKDLFAREFGKAELERLVHSVDPYPAALLTVARDEYERCQRMLGEKMREVVCAVSEMDHHIRIGVHFERLVHIIGISVRIRKYKDLAVQCSHLALKNSHTLYIITLIYLFVYPFLKIHASFLPAYTVVKTEREVFPMEFDRNALSRLLSLNDAQLRFLVNKFSREHGLDLASYNVTEGDISSVRRALANLSDAELRDLGQKLSGGRR